MCGVINVTNDFLQHSKSCYVVKYCNSIKVATDIKLRKYGGDFSASTKHWKDNWKIYISIFHIEDLARNTPTVALNNKLIF
jgi:hypothetical protein